MALYKPEKQNLRFLPQLMRGLEVMRFLTGEVQEAKNPAFRFYALLPRMCNGAEQKMAAEQESYRLWTGHVFRSVLLSSSVSSLCLLPVLDFV